MIIQNKLSVDEKLKILSDAAKYDVACTSSGSDRRSNKKGIGNTTACGICHAFSGDGRCVSLLKILMSNECVFDCRYCINRRSNDVLRTTFTPREIATLTMEFYRRNYIEGLFLSSGIIKNPTHTMELMLEAIRLLREEEHFGGYIHVKAIPGAAPEVIERMGYMADRMSINLELPTGDGLARLAPNKSRKSILTPMKQVRDTIKGSLLEQKNALMPYHNMSPALRNEKKIFVPAGQSTQMIVGATKERDYELIAVTEALYKNFDLKRVFFSAFINVNEDSELPDTSRGPQLLREHRLYQADFLLRYYGFKANELLSEKKPDFNVFLDPKCDWAVTHLEHFPVEVNKADYNTLLRVPGIGVTSAKRIVAARRHAILDFADLKKLGVVLKRALYFITCSGRMMYNTKMDENYITRNLVGVENPYVKQLESHEIYEQLSLFDVCGEVSG